MTQKEITARSYTLRTESGGWLGQIVITSDGMFSAVTDYGNFSFAWRSTGEDDFREFLVDLGVDYFSRKMAMGMSYVVHGRKIDKACDRFAEEILPAFQKILKAELESEKISA
jgi:hypothetical protein